MATTGDRLVEISTLSTGTALQHLLNVDFGGTGETIYVDRALTGFVTIAAVMGSVATAEVRGEVTAVEIDVRMEDIYDG